MPQPCSPHASSDRVDGDGGAAALSRSATAGYPSVQRWLFLRGARALARALAAPGPRAEAASAGAAAFRALLRRAHPEAAEHSAAAAVATAWQLAGDVAAPGRDAATLVDALVAAAVTGGAPDAQDLSDVVAMCALPRRLGSVADAVSWFVAATGTVRDRLGASTGPGEGALVAVRLNAYDVDVPGVALSLVPALLAADTTHRPRPHGAAGAHLLLHVPAAALAPLPVAGVTLPAQVVCARPAAGHDACAAFGALWPGPGELADPVAVWQVATAIAARER